MGEFFWIFFFLLPLQYFDKNKVGATSLAVQWLRLHTSTAGGIDSIPGKGTKIAAWQKKNNDK